MKVLILFSQPWALGGAETHVTDLAKGLAGRGHDVYLAVHANRSPQLEGVVKEQFVLNFRSKNPWDYVKLGKQLAEIVKRHEITIVHAHQRTSGYIGAYVRHLTKVPFLVTIHDPWNRAYGKKLHAKIYNHIITVSEFLRQRFIHDFGFGPERVHTIYNGADQNRYNSANYNEEQTAPLRKTFGINPGERVVTLMARLYKSKGQQYLIEAAALLKQQKIGGIKFLLVGDGPHESLLKAMVRELGLDDNFIFAGYRQDIPEIIALSDIVVRPSLMEGLPINVIEAMLMAKPVIASKIAGVPEMIEQGINGFMIEVGDVGALAGYLSLLLNDAEKLTQIGQAAQKTALEKFTIDQCVARTEKLYQSLGTSNH